MNILQTTIFRTKLEISIQDINIDYQPKTFP